MIEEILYRRWTPMGPPPKGPPVPIWAPPESVCHFEPLWAPCTLLGVFRFFCTLLAPLQGKIKSIFNGILFLLFEVIQNSSFPFFCPVQQQWSLRQPPNGHLLRSRLDQSVGQAPDQRIRRRSQFHFLQQPLVPPPWERVVFDTLLVKPRTKQMTIWWLSKGPLSLNRTKNAHIRK